MSIFDLILLLAAVALLASLAFTLAEPRFEIPERPVFHYVDLGVDDWRDLAPTWTDPENEEPRRFTAEPR